MKLRINEIFYSLQGEGFYTGTPAVFIRMSGCNRSCAFCDTDFAAFTPMDYSEIIAAIAQYPARHVVITGGEPALQLRADLVDLLHQHGYYVQVETNGSLPLPPNVDWVTCSPKAPGTDALSFDVQPDTWLITHVDELKIVYRGQDVEAVAAYFSPKVKCLQPCAQPDGSANTAETITYILAHPQWRLSLQTHKLLDIK